MSFSQESAVKRAKTDLAHRLSIAESEIKLTSVSEKDFPNASLGVPVKGEMSAQMISSGWQIDCMPRGRLLSIGQTNISSDCGISKVRITLSSHRILELRK